VRNGYTNGFQIEDVKNASSLNYVEPFVAYVSDNTLSGYTGPIMGRRYRFEVQPSIGSYRWVEYLADYRRYQPIIFNFITVAVRGMSSLSVGRDETVFPKYIGYPQFVRGYDREEVFTNGCGGLLGGGGRNCRATELLGSRVALANAELRFPLIRRFELGLLPIALPPLDGLLFYDAGVAWSRGQSVEFDRERAGDDPTKRVPVTSYGAGLRLNLFGFAVVRWDYAIPISRPERKGFWSWSIGPSF
jgi:outer membrane protein assembly factor BamA